MPTAKIASGRMMGGREPQVVHPAFCQYGDAAILGPVVIAVPHAGREYPADLVERSRVGIAGLQALEDRHADLLATGAIAAGHPAVIARRGRAILDLNRHEGEIDNASVSGIPHGAPLRASAKLRGGLGLVPHRYHSIGDIWQRRPDYAEVVTRIRDIHTPYHACLAQMLEQARLAHGAAILIDLHSMPSIRAQPGHAPTGVVLGDRFGQGASAAITRSAAAIVASHGFSVAINAPYAGGYTLERHGRPLRNVHALQVEIDRSLYLDADLKEAGQGAERCIAMVTDLADRLAGMMSEQHPLAAE